MPGGQSPYTNRLGAVDPYGRSTPNYANAWGGYGQGAYQKQQAANRESADAYSNYRQADLGDRFGLTALGADVGPDGRQTVKFGRDPMADLEGQLSIRDKYNAAAEQRYMDQISKFTTQSPENTISRDSGAVRDAEKASEAAAFARAKDREGLLARGSLQSAQDVLAGRGLLGSGLESQAYKDIINKGQQTLSDTVRQQAVDSVDRAERRADTEYSGAITQRGQNMAQAQSMLSLLRRGGAIY